MNRRRPRADVLLARHWLTHPAEPAYQAALHMGLEPRTVQKAALRLRQKEGGTTERALLDHVRAHPIDAPKAISLRHPDAERWLKRTKTRFLLSGEDAAVVDGWDLVPHRHLIYVDDEQALRDLVASVLKEGARVAEAEAANLTIRVRDAWLMEEPKAFVERGQRLIDYLDSKNVQFLIQLKEQIPEAEP